MTARPRQHARLRNLPALPAPASPLPLRRIVTPTFAPGVAPEDAYTASVAETHRKSLGQFFTPAPVAEFMAGWVVNNPACRTILDPAMGLGIFFRAIHKLHPRADYDLVGYDVDPTILGAAQTLFKNSDGPKVRFVNKDYLFNGWSQRYDAIICNPPYFKFQDYVNRAAGLEEFKSRLGMSLSGFTNIYSMFILKSISQLPPGGRAAYLVPFEFLNADYGTVIKKHLLESKALRYVILFSSAENVFRNALTTSCILLFANDEHSQSVTFINARNAEDLQALSAPLARYPERVGEGKQVRSSDLDPEVKWKAYYQKQSGEAYRNLVPLGTYAKVVRGIATGDNGYFTFDEEKKARHGIADRHLLPCLTRAAQARSNFFTGDDFETLRAKGSRVFLLNAVDLTDEAVRRYVESGVEAGVDKKYLTSHRTPWHSLENRQPAPLLVTVFNRHGLRFVRNEAGVRNLTCFHSVYPNLFAAAKLDLLTAYLLTNVAQEIFKDSCREYGGGLNKFEPNDLNGASVVNLNAVHSGTARLVRQIYRDYRASVAGSRPDADALAKLDDIFLAVLAK